MQFVEKAYKHGWGFLILGVGIFITAGVAYSASSDAPTKDMFGKYILEWDQLSQVDKPLLTEQPRKIAQLTLEECIRRVLAHNLDIRISSHDPAIRMADVVQAEAAFDAVLFSSANFSKTDEANPESGFFNRTIQTSQGTKNKKVASDPFVQLSDHQYALGLRKRLPTGAIVELAQRARRLRVEEEGLFRNPFYETNLFLELQQPLLRDFGIDLNRARINAARNDFAISRQQFNLQVIRAVAEVEGHYWQLVFLRQRIRILEELVRQSEATLSRLKARTPLDAGAGVIARNRGLIERARADLVAARNDVLQQQSRLLESMNDPNLSLKGIWEIIPTDEPAMQPYPVARNEAMQTSLQFRPELISQEITIDTAQIALGVAKNQILPRLDLIARQEVTAPGGSMGTAWQDQHDYDTVNYLAGLSFEIPLGNRSARAELRKAELQERQEKLRLDSFKEQVLLDVSVSLQELNSSHEEIAARLAAAIAEADELRAYLVQENADAKIDANFLNRKLDAQERLARVQVILAQSILRYNVAIADIHRAQGTLLHHNNISLAEMTDKNK
jgi:outer membrane protein